MEGIDKTILAHLPAFRTGGCNDTVLDAGQGFGNGVEDHPIPEGQETGTVQSGQLGVDAGIEVLCLGFAGLRISGLRTSSGRVCLTA